MPYRVVTIARAIGAYGEEIGGAVASGLGFRLVDDEIIVKAAARAGASPEAVERAEQRRPLLSRMIEAMAAVPPPEGFGWSPELFEPPTRSTAYQAFITDVIQETAKEGNVVIVAHGAGVPLAGQAGVFRVFVTASPATRAARLADLAKLDAARASANVRDSDKSRADFLHRFYGLREEAPTTYDLVVNTDSLSVMQAANLIVAAARDEGGR